MCEVLPWMYKKVREVVHGRGTPAALSRAVFNGLTCVPVYAVVVPLRPSWHGHRACRCCTCTSGRTVSWARPVCSRALLSRPDPAASLCTETVLACDGAPTLPRRSRLTARALLPVPGRAVGRC